MKTHIIIIYLSIVVLCAGCGDNFLDLKPNQNQKIPQNIADYQALMDNTNLMNRSSSHALGIIGSDEYTIPDDRYDVIPVEISYNFLKRAYNWDSFIFEGGEVDNDWNKGYSRVLECNIVLDGLKKIKAAPLETEAWNKAKGTALFYRALNFYNLAQLFCLPFNPSTSPTDLGLPLRIEADVTVKVPRSTVLETYQKIIGDVTESIDLLPSEASVFFRPSKAAAYALLSRISLQMNDFVMAADFASKCLAIKNKLMDFNGMDFNALYDFPANGAGNPEIIFYSTTDNILPISASLMDMDPELYASYTVHDLRPQAYFYNFSGRTIFTGTYSGIGTPFTGLATDEILLTRAECYAREGKLTEAMDDLNDLAINRYEKTNFNPFSAGTPEQALSIILNERKKELLFRGTRWEDLRRLNKEAAFAKKLVRNLKGKVYELQINDVRYAWPLPVEAIAAGGYTQNIR